MDNTKAIEAPLCDWSRFIDGLMELIVLIAIESGKPRFDTAKSGFGQVRRLNNREDCLLWCSNSSIALVGPGQQVGRPNVNVLRFAILLLLSLLA